MTPVGIAEEGKDDRSSKASETACGRDISVGPDIRAGAFSPDEAASAVGSTIRRQRAIETTALFMRITDTGSGRRVFKKPSTPFA